ncbi:MAG: glycosyltransferase family 2 protein [bacterium]|nr:glycosyltransferase family 2 protein [bacterium]
MSKQVVPVVSIIIVNYKTAKLTSDAVNSLLTDTSLSIHGAEGRTPIEIIVIDNASADGSAAKLEQDFGDRITLLTTERNLGFGPANNLGATQAKGLYLFFLNSDTLELHGAVTTLVAFLDRHPGYGVVGPKVLLPDKETIQPASFGRFPTLTRTLRRTSAVKKPQLDLRFVCTDTDWVTGAALMITAAVFWNTGGFDQRYFMYFEDQDVCANVIKMGAKIAVVHDAAIVHFGGQSLPNGKKKYEYYDHSQEQFFLKHYGWLKTGLMVCLRFPWKIWRSLAR